MPAEVKPGDHVILVSEGMDQNALVIARMTDAEVPYLDLAYVTKVYKGVGKLARTTARHYTERGESKDHWWMTSQEFFNYNHP